MVIKIDFDALIKVVLNELEKQHPNEVMSALQQTKLLLDEEIKEHPKASFTLLCTGIVLIDGQSSPLT